MPKYRFTEQQGVIQDGVAEQPSFDTVTQTLATVVSATSPVTYTAAGAIAPTGIAVLKTGAASAMTLVVPPTGASLTIVAADAFAYVVTTPANKVNGNADTLTWAAAVGNSIQLTSSAGIWYQVSNTGVTLTEV